MKSPSPSRRRVPESGAAQVRLVVTALAFFLLGAALSAVLFQRARNGGAAVLPSPAAQSVALSAGTRDVLQHLRSPVDIQFYALLDPATVSASLRDYAARVGRLLAAYQQAAPGVIRLTQHATLSDANANAAAADGLEAFNLEKGSACFLGVALACDGQKMALRRLRPEWAAALESDLSRAIQKVSTPKPAPPSTFAPAKPTAAAVSEVRHLIPNLASVSVEDGIRILQQAALKNFKAAAAQMADQLKEAQDRLSAAQSGTQAERQAAMKNLQQVQARQTEALQQIAAQLQSQIVALKQLKAQ